MLNAPSEAVALVKQNVRVSCDNFLAEKKVPVGHVHPSLDFTVLSLSGSSSPNDKITRYVRSNNVYMQCTPLHTAHKLHHTELS